MKDLKDNFGHMPNPMVWLLFEYPKSNVIT
jgi:hypothetical protein